MYLAAVASLDELAMVESIGGRVLLPFGENTMLKAFMDQKASKGLFLDSGAFTAFKSGKPVNLDNYIQYIKDNVERLAVYANLDVIGDAAATWVNQRIMEKAGLHPLPCFHYGDPIQDFDKMCEEYDYIALGGIATFKPNKEQKSKWLDLLFSRKPVFDRNGKLRIKFHGFGMTSVPTILRYPWWSIDSTSWRGYSRTGIIHAPYLKADGSFDFTQPPLRVGIAMTQELLDSECLALEGLRPRLIEEIPHGHFQSLSPREKETLLKWLTHLGMGLGKARAKKVPAGYELEPDERWMKRDKGEGGTVCVVEEDGPQVTYQARCKVNACYFQELADAMPKWPWKMKHYNTAGGGLLA